MYIINSDVAKTIVSDTGSNIMIIRQETAQRLGLPVYTNNKSTNIIFGNNKSTATNKYVKNDGLIKEILVMEDHELPIDLSDILMFTNRGMDVMYSINGVFVTHNGKEIIRGDFDKQSQLWYFDIKNILKIPDIPNLKIKNTDNESTVLIVNRLKAEDISIIRQTHKNFAHLAPSALANIIDSKVLDDVPIGLTGSAIRSLNKTQQCIVCEAGRGKELPAKEGSGATPGIIGAYWSVDYVGPINPPTTWGCNGFIVYEELAT
jgi:hypothetical protein